MTLAIDIVTEFYSHAKARRGGRELEGFDVSVFEFRGTRMFDGKKGCVRVER